MRGRVFFLSPSLSFASLLSASPSASRLFETSSLGKRRLRLLIATPLFGTACISMSLVVPVERKKRASSEMRNNGGALSALSPLSKCQRRRRRPERHDGNSLPPFYSPAFLSLSCPFHHFQTQALSTQRLRRPGASGSRPDTSGSVTRYGGEKVSLQQLKRASRRRFLARNPPTIRNDGPFFDLFLLLLRGLCSLSTPRAAPFETLPLSLAVLPTQHNLGRSTF